MAEKRKIIYDEAKIEIINISRADIVTSSGGPNPDDSLNPDAWDN